MDDDSPDDVALRTLARQLFGDHGLGRDTAGERATVRSIDGGRHPRRSSPPTTAPAPRRSPSPATSTTTRSSPRSSAAFAAMPAGDGRIARSAPGAARDRRRDRRRLRAGAPRHRRPVGAARRPRPRGARRRQPRVRRRAVEPAVRRDPRAPRPRLQRVLGDVGLRRRRRVVGVRRGDARARRRGRAAGRRPSSTGSSPTASPTTSWRSPSATSPAPTRWASRTPGARMSRLGGMLATLGRVDPGRRAARPLGGRHARRRPPRDRPRLRRRRARSPCRVGPAYDR